MIKEEFAKLAKSINATWPNTIITQEAFSIWYEVLKDLDYEVAAAALIRHMSNSEFAPKPASIRKNAVELCTDNVAQLTPQEAWTMVYKAICRSSYYAEDEFNKLPPEVQRAVGGPERLRELAIDSNFNEGVESSNFMRTFSELQKKGKEIRVLPEALRLAMEEAKMIGEANGKDLHSMRKGISG